MLGQTGLVELGLPTVVSTSGRGFSPEELAHRAVAKIVSVSSSIDDPIVRAQAEAFKEQVFSVVLFYLKQAVASNHTTLTNRFIAAGHPELVALLKEH